MAGIYGLFAAKKLSETGRSVCIVECDDSQFQRASYINQARVHNGYHYPRSISTAMKSHKYYDRFNKEFSFAINSKFTKIYAISSSCSLTNAEQFLKFCCNTGIMSEDIHPDRYFIKNSVEGAFLTEEFSFDGEMVGKWFIEKLKDKPNVKITFAARAVSVDKTNSERFSVTLNSGEIVEAGKVLNATYAGTNQVSELFGFEKFNIKYEICEMSMVTPNAHLKNIGFTVMDGPFFSVMPFGCSPFHSLTSVTFTPHITSYEKLPKFKCQENSNNCTSSELGNCNLCLHRPISSYTYMKKLADKYLLPEYAYEYVKSLFAIKPILKASEIDDSRPTVIRKHSSNPDFYSVLSGKFNTIYDLEEIFK